VLNPWLTVLRVNSVDISSDPAKVRDTNELTWVREAASGVQTARACLLGELVAAHEAGHALRALAEAAGLSHERVRLLLRESQAS
jgi:hypothetical protein